MGAPQLLMCRPSLDVLPAGPALCEGYVVRAYAAGDREALAGLLTAAFAEPWPEDRVRRDLTEAPDVEQVYVVAYHGTPVATASARLLPDLYPGSGYLHWVGAHPDHQGKGLGTLVSLRVLRHFREAGLRNAVLETDDDRLPAIRSYLKLGFIPQYRHPSHEERWSSLLAQLTR